jgi:hypothetical protein
MADLSDVEAKLAALVTTIVYPQGTDAPALTGGLIRIYRGWPNQSALNADLAAGTVTITIFADPAQARITTRYLDPPEAGLLVNPSLTATTCTNAATFSGLATPGQIAGILVDNSAFVHRTVTGDTPELVASILASYVRSRRPAQIQGATITIPGAGSLIARVVADQTTQTETRRQVQGFRLSFWCPDPTTRDQVAALVDQSLSAQASIDLPDATTARLRQSGTTVFDQSQNAGLYRRDLLLSVEYATTIATTQPALIFCDARLMPNAIAARSLLG